MAARVKFYARGTAQVTDPHAQDRGVRRCVGRRWQEVTTGRWAWVPTEDPQEIDYHHDLAKACRDGDLWAADEATAKACGVPFDPSFGGELTQTIKAYKASKTVDAKPAEESKKVPGGKADV
jgi:hypothetical protein